jgi:hypothetical protein
MGPDMWGCLGTSHKEPDLTAAGIVMDIVDVHQKK